MSTLTNDAGLVEGRATGTSGLTLALVSALTFGLAGVLARPLLETGWSAGTLVLVRTGLAAIVVLPLGLTALGGRWHLLRRNAGLIALYGVLAVGVTQFCYFSAVRYLQAGPALLIEYTAPAAIVVWLWWRRGERPGTMTLIGGAVAGFGLLIVLDIITGTTLSLPGVLWALGAMVGMAAYFLISADESNELPAMTLAAGGLVTGTAALGLLALAGVLPMATSSDQVAYAGRSMPAWVPLVLLAVVTAAIAFTTGVAAVRRLGSRLASFIALSEVLAAVLWSWLLLSEIPGTAQLLGGVLVLAGVVLVKLGERAPILSEHPACG